MKTNKQHFEDFRNMNYYAQSITMISYTLNGLNGLFFKVCDAEDTLNLFESELNHLENKKINHIYTHNNF